MSEKLKNNYCCGNMDYYSDPNYKRQHEILIYHPEVRRYNLVLHGKDKGMQQTLQYCPWCGQKLPKTLGEEWCKIIEEKFGYDIVGAEEFAKLPEEFRTDEWWKKRGL